jgi:hypothetical protein
MYVPDDIDRYYRLANAIAGELGSDLLHHILISFDNKKNLKGDDLYRYLRVCLKNEFYNKNSTFNKLYNCKDEEVDYDCKDTYDTVRLTEILEELSSEGHEYKVNLFKDVLYGRQTVKQIAKEMKVSRMYIYRNFITFVREEIRKRYVDDI